jgi:hypothetical protein
MSTSARQLPVTKTRKHRYAALPPHADRVFKVAHGVKVQLRVFPAFGYEDTDGVSTAPVDWGPKGAPWLLWFHGGGLL